MLMKWSPKGTFYSGSLICSVLPVVEVTNNLTLTWAGWVPSHKNPGVDRAFNPVQFPVYLTFYVKFQITFFLKKIIMSFLSLDFTDHMNNTLYFCITRPYPSITLKFSA